MSSADELDAAVTVLEHYANAWCEDADGQAFSTILDALAEARETVELIERLTKQQRICVTFSYDDGLYWADCGDEASGPTLRAALEALSTQLPQEKPHATE